MRWVAEVATERLLRESRAQLLLLEIAYEVSLSGDLLASGEHVLLSSHERIQQFVAIHGEAPHDPSRLDDSRTYAPSAPYVLLIGQVRGGRQGRGELLSC